MDTITIHAQILALADQGGAVPPSNWCHDLVEGSLSCRLPGSDNTFTWDAEAIAAMSDRDDCGHDSAAAKELLARWAAVSAVLESADRPLPTKVLVDHDSDEMTLLWETEKLAVIVGPDELDGPAASSA